MIWTEKWYKRPDFLAILLVAGFLCSNSEVNVCSWFDVDVVGWVLRLLQKGYYDLCESRGCWTNVWRNGRISYKCKFISRKQQSVLLMRSTLHGRRIHCHHHRHHWRKHAHTSVLANHVMIHTYIHTTQVMTLIICIRHSIIDRVGAVLLAFTYIWADFGVKVLKTHNPISKPYVNQKLRC